MPSSTVGNMTSTLAPSDAIRIEAGISFKQITSSPEKLYTAVTGIYHIYT